MTQNRTNTAKTLKMIVFTSLLLFTSIQSFSQKKANKADKLNIKDFVQIKKEVLDHIDKIFKAFVAKDTLTIRNLHSEDWTGFQQFGDLKRNRDGYMLPLRQSLPSMTGYHIDDSEVQIFTDIVLVHYQATIRNNFQGREVESQIKSLDVFQKRKGEWTQIACHLASRISFAQYVQMRQAEQK